MTFVKLFASILDSSVWGESAPTVKVWIALLAMADKNGNVFASVPGLTRRAAVSRDECETALAIFLAPDKDSQDIKRNPENEGRRIKEVEGGWHIINHSHYREYRTEKQIADAERIRDKRITGEYDSRGPVTDDEEATEATRSIVSPYADVDGEVESDTEIQQQQGECSVQAIVKTLGIPEGQRTRWSRMLVGMTQGLGTAGMKAVPLPVLLEAAIELSTAPGDVNAHRYKIFVNKVLQRQQRPAVSITRGSPRGFTLAATSLIRAVRERRNPQFPNSLIANWKDGLTETQQEVVKNFGIPRLLNDPNEGTLVAQLAKALEEAA